ncbi:DUF2207 domain-containing protein [Liquorilactobacillus capillatus]|nr:DUF2207 domain-containing protein [Liquorilactobacillus capillatus]
MRNKWWVLGFIAALCGVFFFLTTPVHADNEYDITRYHVDVNVLKNGDAELTQRITYKFDGDFHGVYYNQDLRGIKGASNVNVSVLQNGVTSNMQQAETEANNTYTLQQTNDNLRLKLFHAISDDSATFTYRYLLHGVITNYNDTAELNWKIIGEKWDVPLKNVLIKIQLPQNNIKELQGWTHGTLDGQTTVKKQAGQVLIRAKENPENQFIESHLLFPISVTPDNPNKVDKNVKQKLQQQEAELARKANEERKRSRQRTTVIKYTVLAVSLLSTVGWWLWRWRNPGNPQDSLPPLVHSYEIPLHSAEITQIIIENKDPDSKAFSAYLLELAAAKKITIEKTGSKKNDYTVSLLNESLLDKDSLLKLLFTQVGDGNSFSLKQLDKFGKKPKHSSQLYAVFSSWQKRVFREARDLGYYDQVNAGLRIAALWATIISSFLLVITIAVFWDKWWSWLLIGAIIMNIILCYSYRKRRPKYSTSGWQLFYQISCFKKMLQDIGRFDMKKVGDLILWEQILPYAVAFGLAKKVIKELRTNFSAEELETNFGVYYPIVILGATNFGTAFNNSFSSAITSSSSSISGGSGGFSGGSSGGFGGGSGGGAF